MPEDKLTQLLQRIKYLERALVLQKADYAARRKKYDTIIEKLRSMVNDGEITSYLTIDAIYYHLLEKINAQEPDFDKSAAEIRDFIA